VSLLLDVQLVFVVLVVLFFILDSLGTSWE